MTISPEIIGAIVGSIITGLIAFGIYLYTSHRGNKVYPENDKMELKEFISEALNQIIDGIVNAQNLVREKGALIAPGLDTKIGDKYFSWDEQSVEFDVAITTSETTGGEANVGIFVAELGIGAKGQTESTNQTISHVKFSIPIYFPSQRKHIE